MSEAAPVVDVADIEVVAPNFKRRLSGVTSTIIQLVPLQARTLAIATLGPGLPAGLPRIGWRQPRPASPAAPPAVPHLARPPQRRDDRRRPAARRAPGTAEAGLHLGRAAQSPAAHQMADQAHGCGDRHQSALGQFPRGAAHRDHARRRSREIPSRRRSRTTSFPPPACRAGAPSAASAASASRRAPTSSSTR